MQDNQEAQQAATTAVATTGLPPARFNWTGLNPTQMKGVAQAMAMSGMFPDIQRDSAKAFVKIMAGQEMGIPPFQAMSDISIIQGKAAAGGNIYASKVKAHPKYDYKIKQWNRAGCAIEFFQRNPKTNDYEPIGVSEFKEEDARSAQLLGKDSWRKYPRNMYFNRAMTAGVRTYCPDATNGVNAYTPEELGANVNEDGSFVGTAQTEPAEQVHTVKPQPQDAEPANAEADGSPTQQSDAEPVEDTDLVELARQQTEADQQTKPAAWVVPEFKRPQSGMVRPEQTKLIKKWLEHLETKKPGMAETFVPMLLGHEKPANYDEAMAVIEELATQLNAITEAHDA